MLASFPVALCRLISCRLMSPHSLQSECQQILPGMRLGTSGWQKGGELELANSLVAWQTHGLKFDHHRAGRDRSQ